MSTWWGIESRLTQNLIVLFDLPYLILNEGVEVLELMDCSWTELAWKLRPSSFLPWLPICWFTNNFPTLVFRMAWTMAVITPRSFAMPLSLTERRRARSQVRCLRDETVGVKSEKSMTLCLISSRRTSANASSGDGKGSRATILPLTSSSSRLRPARKSNTLSFSKYPWSFTLQVAQRDISSKNRSNYCHKSWRSVKYWVTDRSPCFMSFNLDLISNIWEAFPRSDYIFLAASQTSLAVVNHK